MESNAQLVSSEFPIGVRLGSDQETYSLNTHRPLNHFHPVLLQKSNSGLRCVFRIIVMLEKCTTTKGMEQARAEGGGGGCLSTCPFAT